MAGPNWNAVFANGGGGSSSAPATPAAAAPSNGPNWNATFGAPAATSSSGGGGGGGFLGTLERIPGSIVNDVVPTIENTVLGTGKIIYDTVKGPSLSEVGREWSDLLLHKNLTTYKGDTLIHQDVPGVLKSIPPLVEHPLRHPLQTALLLYPAATGVARVGLATKAGLAGETAEIAAGKPLGTIAAKAVEGGKPVDVRVLPRDPVIAARMRASDALLKKVTKPTTPVVGEYARAARAVERTRKVPYLKALAHPALATYQKALAKLGPVDRVALSTLARVPLPKDLAGWQKVLADSGGEAATRLNDVLSKPDFLARYNEFEKFPKIVAAHRAAQALVGETEATGRRTGALTDETIGSSPYIATRVARGAQWVERTPARLGIPNAAHRFWTQEVNSLQKQHDNAIRETRRNAAVAILGLKGRLTVAQKDAALAHLEGTGAAEGVPGLIGNKIVTAVEGPPKVTTKVTEVPRTPEEAQARLDALLAQHNAQIDEMARMQLGDISQQAEAGRTKQNNRTRQAQRGLTKIGIREEKDRALMDAQREKVAALEAKGESPRLAAARAKLAKMEADHDVLYRGRKLNLGTPVGNYGRREILPSIREERRAAQERQIDEFIAGNPSIVERVPEIAGIVARRAEIDRLHEAVQEHQTPEMFREGEAKSTDFGNRKVTETTTTPGEHVIGRVITPLGGARAEKIGASLSHAKDMLERLEARRLARMQPTGLVGGGTPEGIAAEAAQAGRPEPFKLPDRPYEEKGPGGNSPTLGSGLTVPTSGIHESHGTLFSTGHLDLTSDVLTPHYLAMARYEAKIGKHQAAMDAAAPIPKDAPKPLGTEYVRTRRGERTPFLQGMTAEHLAELDKVLPGERGFVLSDAEAADHPDLIATDAEGNRLVVSKEFADGLAHQYQAENRVLKLIVTRPLDVWRALVLNLRVPWLLNNIVGNHFLYALKFAGVGGLRAYVNMLRDMRPGALQSLLKSDATRSLSSADIQAIFPEQTRGTFIGTQLPTGKVAATRVGRGLVKSARVLNAGLAPLDKHTEMLLRRGGVNTVLRNSPEAKVLYKAMPKQAKSWRDAMKQAASENPHLRELANREVNDALGDFLSLNAFERGVLRRTAPFYGWYREITRIAAHTALNSPLRVLILSRLAQLENDSEVRKRGEFPTFLQGSLALGPGPQGTENILSLRGVNPLSTVTDIGRAASTFVNPGNRSNAEALLGLMNPFGEAAASQVFGSSTGSPLNPAYQGGLAAELAKYGLPGYVLGAVAGGLPQAQVLSPPPPSRLYPLRDRWSILEALAGSPLKQPNLQQAHYYASQNR